MAFSGDLCFNPITDLLTGANGEKFRFHPPTGDELPSNGYDPGLDTYQKPPGDRSGVRVEVCPKSDRLQLMTPFPSWNGKDIMDAPILIKVSGKCTTDHIRQDGKHLDILIIYVVQHIYVLILQYGWSLAQIPWSLGQYIQQPIDWRYQF